MSLLFHVFNFLFLSENDKKKLNTYAWHSYTRAVFYTSKCYILRTTMECRYTKYSNLHRRKINLENITK